MFVQIIKSMLPTFELLDKTNEENNIDFHGYSRCTIYMFNSETKTTYSKHTRVQLF